MINAAKHSRNKQSANVYNVGKQGWPHFILANTMFINELTLILNSPTLHRQMDRWLVDRLTSGWMGEELMDDWIYKTIDGHKTECVNG